MMKRPTVKFSQELLTAYANTHYKVSVGESTITLQPEHHSNELEALHQRHNVSSSAFVTAWNPESISMSRADNDAATPALEAAIERLGFQSLPGIGVDAQGQWPGEESLLILGIPESAALEIGAAFRQNAIVFCPEDAIPLLLFPDLQSFDGE